MNEHLKNALIFLGLLLATFGTMNTAVDRFLQTSKNVFLGLYWMCWIAILVFFIMETIEVILMWKDVKRERLMKKIQVLIAQSQ